MKIDETIKRFRSYEIINSMMEELKILREEKSEFQIIARDNLKLATTKLLMILLKKLNQTIDLNMSDVWIRLLTS